MTFKDKENGFEMCLLSLDYIWAKKKFSKPSKWQRGVRYSQQYTIGTSSLVVLRPTEEDTAWQNRPGLLRAKQLL